MSEGPISNTLKQDYSNIVNHFLSKQPFTLFSTDTAIEDTVLSRCLSHNIPEKNAQMLASHGTAAAKQFYPLHSAEIQKLIALYTAYFGAIDDLGEDFIEGLRKFGHDMLRNAVQTEILHDYADLLGEFGHFYCDFCSNKIVTGTISFIDACVMEFESAHNFQKLRTAPGFPDYFRAMTEVGEPYTYFILREDLVSKGNLELFIQAVPDIIFFTYSVNDLLSFYKESIVGDERGNFVHLRAVKDGVTVKDVLCSLSVEIQRYAQNIRSTVADDEKLFSVVDAYLRGYIGFHVSKYRYRLSELDIPILDAGKGGT
ncbi:hypothetical protein N7530_006901 [Penicillium desertorum]|uniref:Terpenoid synthase n=1 Tax=Penicillium desertorum TaxID=1303715 RepID=A0A9W9WSK5_9EURO|nr:hypothetical protein N7530_006901 [Penicillium desertorum]